jgi:RNA polymerase sigma factor for flagellar operon FliA
MQVMEHKPDDTELIQQYLASSDPALREEIILRFVPLVHYVLGRLGFSQSMGPDYEDAASQGLLGLIEAVDRYDPRFGAQFSTYATLRIRGKVIDYLRSQDWLSRGARRRARQVQAGVVALFEQLQRSPSDEELAAHLKLNVDAVQQGLIDSSRMILSLDALATVSGDEEGSFYDVLPDSAQPEPSETLEEDELRGQLLQALKSLPEREQLILSLYYHDELTLKEIGAVLSISESRVCQLHSQIILKLRSLVAQQLSTPEMVSND